MFESAELEHDIDKDTFETEFPKLRTELLDTQFDLVEAKGFPVIIIAAGMEGSGILEVVTRSHAILDTRHVNTLALDTPTQEESERPRMYRFWRELPPKGEMGIFVGSWYTEPFTHRVLDKTDAAEFEQQLDAINRFEEMLAAEGALILKFWLHLGKDDQKRVLKQLEKAPRTQWRIQKSLWGGTKRYKEVKSAAEHMLRVTGTEHAPWVVVNAANKYYRGLTVGRTIRDAIQARLAQTESTESVPAPVTLPRVGNETLLTALDLSSHLDKDDYKKRLAEQQDRLSELIGSKKFRKRSVVLVFEGNDAAGKGGAIRRVTEFVDPRLYRVNQIAAPTEEENAQPYLWRFWRRLPRRGHIAIFDRSWYGRVLVERVEGFSSEADWRRAYGEINDFEAEMADADIIVIKFWLAIDKEEQAQRFKAREQTGYKRYKITDEDWRNREKWDEYAVAVCDMVDLTSTSKAPWTLVEANDKYFARVKVLKTICDRIENSLS
ncbi:polyphosphate:AMP phosphotransferase [Thiogranum longum]